MINPNAPSRHPATSSLVSFRGLATSPQARFGLRINSEPKEYVPRHNPTLFRRFKRAIARPILPLALAFGVIFAPRQIGSIRVPKIPLILGLLAWSVKRGFGGLLDRRPNVGGEKIEYRRGHSA